MKKGAVFIYILLIGIIIFLLAYIFFCEYYKSDDVVNNYTSRSVSYLENDNKENDNNKNMNQQENTFNDVFEESIKSIVGITTIKTLANVINSTQSLTVGSGIIVSENGYIVTNQHVAGNIGDKSYVTLYNGKEYEGICKWTDVVIDLAIIKIDETNLSDANIGDSESMKLGMPVYAIGNPLGLDFQRTVTSGIISALNRTIQINDEDGNAYMEHLIQTDASINPGNSGGALINNKGEVIGINTIKITDAEGIGFAIPINTVKPIISSFIKYDEFDESYLGIFAYDNILLEYNNASNNIQGLLVANIDSFGPLKDSSISVGDILVSVDDIQLNTMVQLRRYLYTKNPGDTIYVKYLNSNEELQIDKVILNKK